MKFIWPPLQKIMDDRKKKISEGLIFANNAKKELKCAEIQATKIIEKAKKDAEQILTSSNIKDKLLHQEAKEKTKNDLKNIQKKATHILTIKTNMFKINVQKEIMVISITIAEKLLNTNIK
jgi:F-type H+-transporting ATPase subunit b